MVHHPDDSWIDFDPNCSGRRLTVPAMNRLENDLHRRKGRRENDFGQIGPQFVASALSAESELLENRPSDLSVTSRFGSSICFC